MQVKRYETQDEWMAGRRGKITGSRLKDIVVKRGTGEKKGYYELIAERLALPADGEKPMDRGRRLEEEAVEKFLEKYPNLKLSTDLVLWQREDNHSIAISPDAHTIDEECAVAVLSTATREAVEVKCLSSASHIEAVITKEIPSEYEFQKLQYFIVNDNLKTLYFVMYDPRMPKHLQLYVFVINRSDIEEDIKTYHEYQSEKLAKIEEVVNNLSF